MDVDVDVDADADADADADDSAQLSRRSCRYVCMFGFQRLDVYRCSVRFLALSSSLCDKVPRGFGSLTYQLRRAALSIPSTSP